MKTSESTLIDIFADIDQRVNEIVQAQPAWPCHQGCDLCCRRLPFLPEITKAEWDLLHEGFQRLSLSGQRTVRERITAVSTQPPTDFITCPFLDVDKGECLVYAYRPAACRMYGFYVTRSGNRWCDMIQEKYEAGFAEGIILGNQQAIDRELTQKLGTRQSIDVWFKDVELK